MKLPFDKVYCLHLAEATERYENMMNLFDQLDIKDQVEIWWTVKRPISNKIGNYLENMHSRHYDKILKENNQVYGSVFNCSIEHYTIIKQAYLRGLNTVCIMEDDLQINDNLTINDVETIFNNLPEEWDILRFSYNPLCEKIVKQYLISHKINYSNPKNYFIDIKRGFGGACMYALNRKGMEYYINSMDNDFSYADKPFYYNYRDPINLKIYISKDLVFKTSMYTSLIEKGDS